MIKYRKIKVAEKEQLVSLINEVLNGLERKDFFIPFPEEEIDLMFDDNKVINYGAYDNDKLVGTAQLYLGDDFVEKIKEKINLKNDKTAEFGGALVLKEYRGKGIMKELAKILIEEARKINYEYIVSVAHPENIASNKSIVFIGAKKIETTNIDEYTRNIYLLEL